MPSNFQRATTGALKAQELVIKLLAEERTWLQVPATEWPPSVTEWPPSVTEWPLIAGLDGRQRLDIASDCF